VSYQWRKTVQCLREKRLVKPVRKGIWSLTRRGEKLVARRQQERANLMAQIDQLNERFGDEQIPKAVTQPRTKLKLVRL
jgi:hypothetical protein